MESKNSIQISAFVEGKLVANASIFPISERMKISHRAEFGIAVLEKYWGLGIGKVLTATCLEMAEKMGFAQVELSLLSSNKIGFLLYQKFGFKIWGELEKGFHMKDGRWETELFMVKYL